MGSTNRSRGPGGPAAVFLLAGLYLAATGAASLHLALTPHAVCPEHGHLVHLEGGTHGEHGGPHEGLPSRDPAPGADADALQAGATLSHDPCDLAQHRPGDGVEAPAPALQRSAAPAAGPAAWPVEPAAAPGPRVLARAPKQSPPAS